MVRTEGRPMECCCCCSCCLLVPDNRGGRSDVWTGQAIRSRPRNGRRRWALKIPMTRMPMYRIRCCSCARLPRFAQRKRNFLHPAGSAGRYERSCQCPLVQSPSPFPERFLASGRKHPFYSFCRREKTYRGWEDRKHEGTATPPYRKDICCSCCLRSSDPLDSPQRRSEMDSSEVWLRKHRETLRQPWLEIFSENAVASVSSPSRQVRREPVKSSRILRFGRRRSPRPQHQPRSGWTSVEIAKQKPNRRTTFYLF